MYWLLSVYQNLLIFTSETIIIFIHYLTNTFFIISKILFLFYLQFPIHLIIYIMNMMVEH